MDFTIDYYYGKELEKYSFYKIPKLFFEEPNLKKLSSDGKILYSILLDRMHLSIKNNWRDSNDKIYIYFSLENIQEHIGCSHTKGVKIIAELDKLGLIERKKQGQGKPTKIYVKRLIVDDEINIKKGSKESENEKQSYPQESQDFSKEEVQSSTNEKSRSLEIGSQDFSKMDTRG